MRNKITHDGILKLGGVEIPCYVLENGTRVLSGRGMQGALKLVDDTLRPEQRSGTELARFINSNIVKSFVPSTQDLEQFSPILCYKGNQKINGYEATVLADICDAVLEARKMGAKFNEKQELIANQCEILMRAFAKVGIIALVDEVTGYQYVRNKDELQKILSAYISPELMPWQKRFPDEFYKEMFRLNNWKYDPTTVKRPGVIGTWTNKIIYDQLPPGVIEELKKKTPKNEKGYRTHLHRWLTDQIGNPHLEKQLVSVITLMNVSPNWRKFMELFNRKFKKNQEDDDLI